MRRNGMAAVLSAVLASTCGLAMAGLSTPYTVTTFGVTDAFHTFNGKSASQMGYMTQTLDPTLPLAGSAAAYQTGYTGGLGQSPGQTAWACDGLTLTPIGFSTGQYITSAQYTYSGTLYQTSTGALTGYSRTFGATGTTNGQDAWTYSGGTTTLIPHLATAGVPYYGPTASRTSSYVSGLAMSTQFYSIASTDRHAWVYDGTSTTQLGYYDSVHTSSAGSGSRHDSYAYAPVGDYIRGSSTRFAGASSVISSTTAWIYNAATGVTTQVGYTGGSYTSGTRQSSSVLGLNSSGTSAGYSQYTWDATNSIWLGQTAWVRSATGTMTQLSLAGSKYLDPSGNRQDRASAINASGQVAGYSMSNWSGSLGVFVNSDAWLYSGGNMQVIPMPNTSFTSGYDIRMLVSSMNDAGDVTGSMARFNGTSSLGTVPWVYHGGSVYQTGLFDADHTNASGRTLQSVQTIGDSGVVTGIAYKYNSTGTTAGYDGWVFDPQDHTTTALAFSNRLNGNVYPMFVTPQGWVGGFYDNYITDTQVIGQAFLWSHDTGIVDFNTLAPGGLAGMGIDHVANVTWVSPSGDIYASVVESDGSTSAAIFKAYVPEPGIVMLGAAVSTLALARRARKRVVEAE